MELAASFAYPALAPEYARFYTTANKWDKRELEEAIFPSNSQQKIHSGDYLALHFRSGNTAEFIDKTVNTRELEGKRSLYEFNANIKVDGSSITPKDPGIILSLPSNHNYTQSQLGDMSRLIKNGLFVKGTLSDINQDAIRDITRPELHISTSSTVLSTLEQLGIVHEDSTEGMVPIINRRFGTSSGWVKGPIRHNGIGSPAQIGSHCESRAPGI